MSDAILIGGVQHLIRLPGSLVVRQELLSGLAASDVGVSEGRPANLRAFAAAVCLCIPSLAPRLPAWSGDNANAIGGACVDHLMGVVKLTPKQIHQVVDGAKLWDRLLAGVPTEEQVQISLGNS